MGNLRPSVNNLFSTTKETKIIERTTYKINTKYRRKNSDYPVVRSPGYEKKPRRPNKFCYIMLLWKIDTILDIRTARPNEPPSKYKREKGKKKR